MDPLEIALVVLVSVWTLVSLAIGGMVVWLLQKVRAALARVDEILQTTKGVAEDVRAPVHAVAESVREVFGTPPRRTPLVDPGDPLPTT